MSSRSSSELIEACRAAAKRPVLERLRFLEGLQPIDVDQVGDFVAGVDAWDADRDWLPAALAQLVPPIYWLTRPVGAENELDHFEGEVASRLGDRWIRILLGALTTGLPLSPTLARLHSAVVYNDKAFALFEPVWTHITQLAQHENPYVRFAAARVALLGRRITPAVTAALGELLTAVTADVDDNEGAEHGFVESLLLEIGKAGPLLSALAPRIEPLLTSPTYRATAAQAAGAIGEPQLIPALQRLERAEQAEDDARAQAGRARIEGPDDERRIKGEGAMRRFALWQLTGELAWLGRALDDAEGSLLYAVRIYSAFDKTSVDRRLLEGLVYAAQRPAWYSYACVVLAKIGVPAAAAVAQLPAPPDDYSDTRFAFHHARWRAGLIDDAQLIAELDPLLPNAYRAWAPYVATSFGTPAWLATIRAAIVAGGMSGVFEALQKSPAVAAQFLPDLVAAGRDDLVDSLWCVLPRETFWAHAQP